MLDRQAVTEPVQDVLAAMCRSGSASELTWAELLDTAAPASPGSGYSLASNVSWSDAARGRRTALIYGVNGGGIFGLLKYSNSGTVMI